MKARFKRFVAGARSMGTWVGSTFSKLHHATKGLVLIIEVSSIVAVIIHVTEVNMTIQFVA